MGELRRTFIKSIVACLIRLWLLHSEYQIKIAERVEISTPLNSWKRVTEGVYLLNEGVNPYIGDLIHEPPINLHAYKYIIKWSGEYLPFVFVLGDIITSILLYITARKYLQIAFDEQNKMCAQHNVAEAEEKKLDDAENTQEANIFLKLTHLKQFPLYVIVMYLYNPFTLLNCVAMTSTVFTNMLLALLLCSMVYDHAIISCMCLALCATHSLYPAILICPIALQLSKCCVWRSMCSIFMCVGFIFGLSYASEALSEGWAYLENIYGFILNIHDLRPNIGLFWYFFTEMFEHFRALFISAFQINILFLYIVPLTIRFRKDPVFLATSLILLTAIFKSYPSIGDVGFCLALLPIWTHLFSYLQQGFLVSCCFLVTSVLGPIVWHLWIYSRSANANFYFGATLSFASAQIFLITDVLFAYIKREFWLKNNCKGMTKSSSVKLVLE